MNAGRCRIFEPLRTFRALFTEVASERAEVKSGGEREGVCMREDPKLLRVVSSLAAYERSLIRWEFNLNGYARSRILCCYVVGCELIGSFGGLNLISLKAVAFKASKGGNASLALPLALFRCSVVGSTYIRYSWKRERRRWKRERANERGELTL